MFFLFALLHKHIPDSFMKLSQFLPTLSPSSSNVSSLVMIVSLKPSLLNSALKQLPAKADSENNCVVDTSFSCGGVMTAGNLSSSASFACYLSLILKPGFSMLYCFQELRHQNKENIDGLSFLNLLFLTYTHIRLGYFRLYCNCLDKYLRRNFSNTQLFCKIAII